MEKDRNVSLEELFDYSRVPSRLGLLALLAYAPIGLIILLIRFFIGAHVFLITLVLPKHSYLRSLILRPLLCILGMAYTQEGLENLDPQCKVLVANYTTSLDHSILHLAVPHQLVSVWDYSGVVGWMLGCVDLGARAGKDVLVANAKNYLCESRLPLLTFPESETTNGRVGLLKFSSWSFSLDQPIQPIQITITRPIFDVSTSLLNSFLLTDLFWMLFLPVTIFHFSYLPVQSASADATEDSRRTQTLMATHMGVVGTPYHSSDKLELIKKRHFQGSMRNDVTMTPQQTSQITTERVGGLSECMKEEKVSPPSKPSPATPVFEKNSHYRHLSFQEKKTLMIETARKQYLEKYFK